MCLRRLVVAAAVSLWSFSYICISFQGLERMTLPVGRNGSSGSRTGVLGSFCTSGKRASSIISVYVCAFMWFIHTLQTLVHVLCVDLELHICYLKFVKPSASHVSVGISSTARNDWFQSRSYSLISHWEMSAINIAIPIRSLMVL